jgi:hypothetical protein
MSNQTLEGEDTVVSFSKSKTHAKIASLIETVDQEAFLEDLADALDVEVEDLPTVDAEVVVTFGNSKIRVPYFEAPEKEEDDDEDF